MITERAWAWKAEYAAALGPDIAEVRGQAGRDVPATEVETVLPPLRLLAGRRLHPQWGPRHRRHRRGLARRAVQARSVSPISLLVVISKAGAEIVEGMLLEIRMGLTPRAGFVLIVCMMELFKGMLPVTPTGLMLRTGLGHGSGLRSARWSIQLQERTVLLVTSARLCLEVTRTAYGMGLRSPFVQSMAYVPQR